MATPDGVAHRLMHCRRPGCPLLPPARLPPDAAAEPGQLCVLFTDDGRLLSHAWQRPVALHGHGGARLKSRQRALRCSSGAVQCSARTASRELARTGGGLPHVCRRMLYRSLLSPYCNLTIMPAPAVMLLPFPALRCPDYRVCKMTQVESMLENS